MKSPNVFVRAFLIIAGSVSTVIGFIGIFVPVLPTTPFLLLAAGCYFRSSEKFYHRLLSNRLLGRYIRNYRENRGMTLSNKVFTIALLWATILLSAFVFVSEWWIRGLLLFIAAAVTTHLVRLRTITDGDAPVDD